MKRDRIFICTTDGECAEHGRYIYYCGPCHERWAQANPERVAAIRKLATGILDDHGTGSGTTPENSRSQR